MARNRPPTPRLPALPSSVCRKRQHPPPAISKHLLRNHAPTNTRSILTSQPTHRRRRPLSDPDPIPQPRRRPGASIASVPRSDAGSRGLQPHARLTTIPNQPHRLGGRRRRRMARRRRRLAHLRPKDVRVPHRNASSRLALHPLHPFHRRRPRLSRVTPHTRQLLRRDRARVEQCRVGLLR